MIAHRLAAAALWLFLPALVAAGEHEHGSAASAAAESVPLFDDLGTHHHAITTSSPLAQRYFDQGLRLVYAFNHEEAIRAFQAASRVDPNCAMAWWGIGLALGPNYNLPLDPERDRAAQDAVAKALALAPRASARERDYVKALARRYSGAPGADRKVLDTAYADAMREVASRHPDDLDAATLFAESLMVLRPWDLWTSDGQPQPGTPEIVSTLEAVLKKEPDHPGANHYYMHAVEGSPQPGRALPSAERMPRLVPGAGHLVHMPAHIYMRLGRYAEASESNLRAIAVDRAYLEKWKPGGVYPMMYYPHNLHFLSAAASMEGRSAEALRAARELVAQVSDDMLREMPSVEMFAPTFLFTLARFGKWEEILAQKPPAEEFQYSGGMAHYARGLALAAVGRHDEAIREQSQVARLAERVPAERIVGDNQPARTHLRLAAAVLAGEIAARRKNTDDAVRELTEAVRIEDGLPYTEPPPWYFPVRQSLGAVLLAAGRVTEAEAVYRRDLERNPENGWSLHGLAACLRARGAAEAADVESRFERAWARADVKLTASRF